ncbi:unnamed protein product [Polarella glacialis]|uniref:Plastidal glycolate/glycerate translocator 1, chloroplastic n=1 Tax=Polarella glacialis TaxID=89957 RepID=A0A813LXG7_POLGL|nr:unnamed protein product [Polarella glacialis]CAE8737623.1 unnamed protein product [Polarella glacialis]
MTLSNRRRAAATAATLGFVSATAPAFVEASFGQFAPQTAFAFSHKRHPSQPNFRSAGWRAPRSRSAPVISVLDGQVGVWPRSSSLQAQKSADGAVNTEISLGGRVLQRLQRIAGVVFFITLDFRLKAAGISTPIAGMLGVFSLLVVLEASLGASVAGKVFSALEPGYRFLVKWASLFFVPALVKLPLALVKGDIPFSAVPSLVVLLVLGYLGSFFSCVGIANVFPPAVAVAAPTPSVLVPAAEKPAVVPLLKSPYPRPGAPFKKRWLPAYLAGMAIAVVLAKLGLASQTTAQAAFMLCASLFSFGGGQGAPAQFKALCHPLFTCIFGSWIAAWLWAVQAGPSVSFLDVLSTYGAWPGAGALLSCMLGPAVGALSLLLYERRKLIRQEMVPIMATSVASAAVSLFGTAALARALGLPQALGLASLPRCVTSAIASDMATSLGANQTLTVAMVVVTGFLGVALAPTLFGKLNLKSARTRGLAMAASAHGLGTVSLAESDKEAFPYSAVGFVLVAAASALLVQVPPVRSALVWILST